MINLKQLYKNLSKNFAYLLQYFFIKTLYTMFFLLGYKKASDFGAWLASKIFFISKRNSLILNNLKESNLKMEESDISKLHKEVVSNVGRLFAEFPLVSKFSDKEIIKYVNILGKENLPKNNKRPVILLTGHFGNWEVLVRQFGNLVTNPYVVYRKQNNPLLEKFFQSLRRSNKNLTFVEKKSFARKLSEIIEKKATLGLLCDLKEDGFQGSFLGRKAKIGLSVAKLVCKYNFKIIPVRVDRYNRHYFNINVYPEIKFSKKDLEEKNYEKITMQIYKIYENWIAEHPSNWYWVHNRWSN